jgi:predicted hydrocarbon binding protein
MSKELTLSGEENPTSFKLNPSMLLMMTDSFSEIISYLPRAYGSAGASMIYSMGFENGTHEVKRLRVELKDLGLPTQKNELLEKAFARVSSMGWGKISLENHNQVLGKVNVFVHSNPFQGACENHGTPGCTFLRGYVAGIVAETLEEDVKYNNPECADIDIDCCLLRVNKTATIPTTNLDQEDLRTGTP